MATENLIENAVIGVSHALRRTCYRYVGVFKVLRRRVYFCRGKILLRAYAVSLLEQTAQIAAVYSDVRGNIVDRDFFVDIILYVLLRHKHILPLNSTHL